MNKSIEDIWKQIVDNMLSSLGQETVNLWIKPLNPVSFENNIFTVSVPNVFFSQWLEKNHHKQIEEMLTKIYSVPVTLAYKVQKDISPVVNTYKKTPVHFDTPMPSVIKDQINPKFTFERFVVGSSNRFATASAEAVAKNPGKQFNPLFIYGGVGLGKTHLLHAIGNSLKKGFPNFRILYVTCEKFASDFIEAIRVKDQMPVFKNKYRNLDCLLIDDIQFLVGKDSSQEEFFNLFNTLKDNGKQIVIASDRPQDKLEVEERLMSRFKWGNTVDIQKPDLETRIAILRKKAEEEQFSVPDDIILFIAKKIKSNIRELEGSLLRVTSFIKFTNTPFTLDTVKAILKDVGDPDENVTVTIDKIQEVVANEYSLTVKDLKGKKRSAQIALPRQIAMYLARTMIVDISTTDIGDAFGGRDHTTVMHACNKIKTKLESEPYFVALINKIIKELKTED